MSAKHKIVDTVINEATYNLGTALTELGYFGKTRVQIIDKFSRQLKDEYKHILRKVDAL